MRKSTWKDLYFWVTIRDTGFPPTESRKHLGDALDGGKEPVQLRYRHRWASIRVRVASIAVILGGPVQLALHMPFDVIITGPQVTTWGA